MLLADAWAGRMVNVATRRNEQERWRTVRKETSYQKTPIAALVAVLVLAVTLAWAGMSASWAFAEEEAPVEAAPAETPVEAPVTEEAPVEMAPAEAAPVDAANPLDMDDGQEKPFGSDILWAGNEKEFAGIQVINDLLAAGQNITVSGAQVGGSIRMAGRIVEINDSAAVENITIAAQDAKVNGCTANVVGLAGQSVTFGGTANGLYLVGQNITINGVVNGDVWVYGGHLTIGPGAQIAGTLRGELGEEPVIDPTAAVAMNELTINANKADEGEGASITSSFSWKTALFSVLSCIACALIAEWIAGTQTERAGELLKNRPGSFIGFGVLWTILLPVVICLLCVPIVTIPVALAALFALIAASLVSLGFTAAALGRMLLPGVGRYISALIMGILFGVLSFLPVAGWVIRGVGHVFMIGFLVQAIREGQRKQDPDANEPFLPYATTYNE